MAHVSGRTMMTEDAPMDEEERREHECLLMLQQQSSPMFFANRISQEEYERQKREVTRAAVNELMMSPEYQRKINSCSSCWSLWSVGDCRNDCMECSGYALSRPCPVCNGKCGRLWKRDLEMSRSNNDAHWEGECGLPWEQQRLYLQLVLTDADEDIVLDGMETLSTTSRHHSDSS